MELNYTCTAGKGLKVAYSGSLGNFTKPLKCYSKFDYKRSD